MLTVTSYLNPPFPRSVTIGCKGKPSQKTITLQTLPRSVLICSSAQRMEWQSKNQLVTSDIEGRSRSFRLVLNFSLLLRCGPSFHTLRLCFGHLQHGPDKLRPQFHEYPTKVYIPHFVLWIVTAIRITSVLS